jgi:DNA-binding MarR family transcriptional regulator
MLAPEGRKRTRVIPAADLADELPMECPWLEPGEHGENLQIRDFPTFLILRLANTTKSELTRCYLDPFGITMPEWRLLALVARYKLLPFSEVTSGSTMDKGQVSRTLQSIHRKGLVKLKTVAAGSRAGKSAMSPRVQVAISPRGAALFQKILPVAREHQLKLIKMLSPEECKVFHAVVRRLLQQIPDMDEKA